jgi:heme exporter protein D
MALDIWMRANPFTYIWIGSYGVTMLVFAIELGMLKSARKATLQKIRMMRNSGENE